MELTSGNIFWKEKDEIKNTYPYLTHDTTCDVLIVGGGINGAITAYFLAKEGANVVVCEKNIIGYGTTIASSATLDFDTGIELYKLEKLIGENEARKMYTLYKDAIEDIKRIDNEMNFDTEFSKKNNIYFTNKFMQKSSVLKEYEARRKSGFKTLFIDSHDEVNLNTGIINNESAAVINPYLFTQCLFEYLSTFENVNVYENTEIIDINSKYDEVISKTSNGFKIESSKLIFSTGIETLKYVEELPVEIYKTFTIVTKKIKDNLGINNCIVKDMQDPNHIMRFSNDNRIIFTGENLKYSDRLNDDRYFDMISNDKYRKLYQVLQKMLKSDEDFTIEYAYSGSIVETKDMLPIVDEVPDMPNCFLNLSVGTDSILGATVGAKMLTNAVRGLYSKEMNLFKIIR